MDPRNKPEDDDTKINCIIKETDSSLFSIGMLYYSSITTIADHFFSNLSFRFILSCAFFAGFHTFTTD